MSDSSVFRTDGNKEYRWPPEGLGSDDAYETFTRVTTFISAGEPKPWMKPWVSKLIVDAVVEDAQSIYAYLVADDPMFPAMQQWWDEVVQSAADRDAVLADKAKRWDAGERFQKTAPRKPWNVAALQKLSEAEKVAKYLKAIPDLKRDAAATRGTYVHYLAEQIQQGRSVSYDPAVEPYVENTLKWLDEFQPRFLEVESVVYSDRYRYAGQFDWLAMIDGKVVLGDYKTGDKGIKSSIALQFAAYAGADFIGREDGSKDPVPKIDAYYGVSIRSDGYDVIPVNVDDQVWNHFLGVRETALWINETQKHVLGKPMKKVAA